MVIRVKDIVTAADTQAQGSVVHDCIVRALAAEPVVEVSFDGVDIASSSFMNTSIVRLIQDRGMGEVTRRIKIVAVNRQVADMLRRRVAAVKAAGASGNVQPHAMA
jgi:hypothetical protein